MSGGPVPARRQGAPVEGVPAQGTPARKAASQPTPALSPEAVPFLPRGVRLHFDKVRGAWVLLAPERALRLDAIGHAILSRVDGARSLDAIARDLAATFDAPLDRILADSAGYLSQLLDRRILELRP
ncbi:pyrroloquinoline quinone biosynthesis peptide chaperone PqqD [Amaricoccus sp. W119]|uniref:pyrroloquinoline quinone biosynthesis peptide chaperone PqqD n=1 Tax=Amaricoccus sp. W119 TaxID=3391833 RepID=UPI0039A6E828